MSNHNTEVNSWSAFDYYWLTWRILSIHPLEPNHPWRPLYLVYACIIHFLTTISFSLMLFINVLISDSLEEFVEKFYVIPYLAIVAKYIYVWYVHKNLLDIRIIMDHLDRRLGTEAERKEISESVNMVRRIFLGLLFLYSCLVLSAIPAVYVTAERKLPFPCWVPWDWKSSNLRHTLTVVVELFCCFIQVPQALAVDTYASAFIAMARAHIRALGIRINLSGVASSSSSLAINQEERQAALKRLHACIEDHKDILKILIQLNNIISLTCFFQFVVTAVTTTTVFCFLFYVDSTYLETCNMMFFFVAVCLETFVICYSGEAVFHECEQLTNAIYSSNWYEQNIRFQRTLLQLLHRSQKETEMVSVKLIPIRIATFVAVIKGAYSVFTLLQQMK